MIKTKKSTSTVDTKKLTTISLLGVISVIMAFTPLGYIPLGLLNVTIMHVPVIIAGILLGPLGGACVGAIFGITSLVRSMSSPLAPIFLNPLVSIVPRICIGIVSAYSFKLFAAITKNKNFAVTMASILGTLTNTTLVMGSIYLLYAETYLSKLQISSTFSAVILGILMKNLPLEIIASVILVGVVCKAVKFTDKSKKSKEIKEI